MGYNKLTPELIEQLRAIAPGRVFTGDEINQDYEHDEMPIYGKFKPDVAVEVVSKEEISAVLQPEAQVQVLQAAVLLLQAV